jgi:hypothetical protein
LSKNNISCYQLPVKFAVAVVDFQVKKPDPTGPENSRCLGPLQQAVASRPASVNSPPPIEEFASPVPDNVPYQSI